MPLSEHEQRLLEQIESALYAEDPKFASLYKSTDLRSHYRRRAIRYGIAIVVGLALLLAGVTTEIVALGVAGFVVMLVFAMMLVASLQRMNGKPLTIARGSDRRVTDGSNIGTVGPPSRGADRGRGRIRRVGRGPGPKPSLIERLEERWQRRFEE